MDCKALYQPKAALWVLTPTRTWPRDLTKTLLVMKLTCILLLAAAIHVSAHSTAQTVTYEAKKAPLPKVFAAIKEQTVYVFFYSTEDLEGTTPITVKLQQATLEKALATILAGQPLTFNIQGNTIAITRKRIDVGVTLNKLVDTAKSLITVKGVVTNQQGEGLAGASVEVKNGKRATLTDEKGGFELKNVVAGTILVVSYTGYQKEEVTISASGEAKTIVLPVANNSLDQAQVIAYGSTTQRLNTGDVTTVSAEEIERQPVNNPLLALEGRVPGLFITQSNGLPGTGVTTVIQGQNSIANGNDPFYVIDGVPYTSELLPSASGVLGTSGINVIGPGNPLAFINSSDIESISVLKDAEATAIYGSRAANGAILITTKKGKPGQTRVDINLQQGAGKTDKYLPLLNTRQYLEMRHEAILTDGLTTQANDYDINGLWDTTRYTDWQKTLIGRVAQYTNLSGSISGGTSTTQYLIGGTYHRETTVYPDDFADKKGSLHFNLNTISTNQKFHFQLSGNYLLDDNRLPNQDLTAYATMLAPDAPALYNRDGTLNWMPDSSGASTFRNPIAQLYNQYTVKTSNLIGNAILSYEILPGLDIRSSFGYTNLQANEVVTFPFTAISPENRPYNSREADYSSNNINSWIIEPQANYKLIIGKGKLDALVGSTINQINSDGQRLYGIGYTSDQLLDDISSATSVHVISTTVSAYKYAALFGRINYNWNDKYLMEITDRRDGSSRFGPANQFHDFESIGLGWIFSKENFIQNSLHALSFGKIRVTYGTTGNDQIGNYQYMTLYSSTYVGVPYQNTSGLQPDGLSNPYLQWEETRKMEAGLDLGFLKDRILLNGSYFRNRSSNQLLNYSLPYLTGYPIISRNFPATTQNSGLELMLNTINIKTSKFSWSSHFNLTIPQNKLIAFPNLASSVYSGTLVIGQPINILKVYHFEGVNPQTGVFQFGDGHGGVTPTPDTNYNVTATSLINTNPRLYGGFENNFRYKSFDLDFSFQFTKQTGLSYIFGNSPGAFQSGLGNQPKWVLSRWQKTGNITDEQKYNSDYSLGEQFGAALFSDGAYRDASYIRLKNASLSWVLPHSWEQKMHLQNARLFLQGQNLFTLTHYKGMDPETLSTSSLPPLRVITAGIQVGL